MTRTPSKDFSAAIAVCSCAVFFLFLGTHAHGATIIFQETWNGYADGINAAHKFLDDPNTADETWYGGRFEFFDSDPLKDDLVVRGNTGINISGPTDNYFRMADEGGILFNLDTTGLTDVTLSFNWRTHLAEGEDKLKVGYTTNDPNGLLASFDPITNRSMDFVDELGGHQAAVDWWDDNFTTLLFDRHESSWLSETFALPSNTPSVWVAFFMDDGTMDYGKIDNIVVMAIPEPSSLVLLMTAGCLMLRKRRFA